jgi:hypothetical protein
MPVEQETVLQISCDNPSCPGNDLDAADRTGWTFANVEIYGQPGRQFVFCSPNCVSTLDALLTTSE